MSFPRYPKYSDSGVAWLGEVPAHWVISQSRRLFALRKERIRAGDEQLTASQKYGVIFQKKFMELEDQRVVQVLLDSEILKHVEPNDFVISMRSFQGGIELCQDRGCISSAYVMLVPGEHIDVQFFKYVFKSSTYIQALQSTTNLVRDGQALRFENFALVPLPRVPKDEQAAIAAFLDRETAKIDGLVAEQRRLIELLKEKRQAVISHAVTKGLNPNAPMKPSGIEWLGDVPEHWKLVPLRWASTCRSGDGLPTEEVEQIDDEGHSTRVIGGNGLMGYTHEGNIEHTVLAVGRVGALCGNVHVVEHPAWITDNALVVDANPRIFDLRFLSEILRSRKLNDIASKTAQPLITGTQVSDQRIPTPPFDEQAAITSFLRNETAKFDTLTAEAERAIGLLQERRTALISAAVTGKIDVRGASTENAP